MTVAAIVPAWALASSLFACLSFRRWARSHL